MKVLIICLAGVLLWNATTEAQSAKGRDKLAGKVLHGKSGKSEEMATPADVEHPKSTNGEDARKWTFDDCLNYALTNSTDLRSLAVNIMMAEQDVKQAKDEWLPKISFSTQHSYVNFPKPTGSQISNAYVSNYGLDASWTLWEGNLRRYKLEAAQLGLRQKALAREDVEKNIKLGLLQRYLAAMYASEAVRIAELTLAASERIMERVRGLTRAGRSPQATYIQLENQYARDRYTLVQARGELEAAKVALKAALQIRFDIPFDIACPEIDDTDALAPLPLIEDVYASAMEWLPELRINRVRKGVYAANVKIARAGYFPKVALSGAAGAGYASGGRSWKSQIGHGLNERIGVKIDVPIFDANATKRAVAKARLGALRNDVEKDSLESEVSRTIEGLYTDVHNAQAGYMAGMKQLEVALLAAGITTADLEKGKVDAFDVLTAHNNLAAARLEVLKCKYLAMLAGKTLRFYATKEVNFP